MFNNPFLKDVKKLLEKNSYLVRSFSDHENDSCELIIPSFGSIIYNVDRHNNKININNGAKYTLWDVPEYAITPIVIADMEQKLLANFLYSLDCVSCHDAYTLQEIEMNRLFKPSDLEENNKKEEVLFELSFNLKDPEVDKLAKDFEVEKGLNIIRGILLEK